MKRAGFLFVGVLAACSNGGETAAPPFQDRLLATIPAEFEIVLPAAFSPDGSDVAYRAKAGHEEWYAVRGTWKSRRLDFL